MGSPRSGCSSGAGQAGAARWLRSRYSAAASRAAVTGAPFGNRLTSARADYTYLASSFLASSRGFSDYFRRFFLPLAILRLSLTLFARFGPSWPMCSSRRNEKVNLALGLGQLWRRYGEAMRGTNQMTVSMDSFERQVESRLLPRADFGQELLLLLLPLLLHSGWIQCSASSFNVLPRYKNKFRDGHLLAS